jgi:EAL domain-containing protein (putative c-di-GMP-specific phosphodiesterase class I)
VLERDSIRAAALLSMLRALGIKNVTTQPSLDNVRTQIEECDVDILLAEIRPDSSEGLRLPCLLKALQNSGVSLISPRILWMVAPEQTKTFNELKANDSPITTIKNEPEIAFNGISIKALDAHAQLARNSGFAATTLYSFSASAVSKALHALLAIPVLNTMAVSVKNHAPSEEDVISALATGDGLRVVFQPQHNLRTGKIIGAEALVRWHHERFGNISPADLIPLVNKLNLHLLLFSFVKAKVIETLCTLKLQNIEIPISVNASVDTVCTAGFSDRLASQMKRANLPNHLLKVELTEEVPVADELCLSAALNALSARGFRLSLDDFGAGSATLRQVSRMPFDEVKIDASLIHGMDRSPPARRIVAATLALARRLNMAVVAEGIESESCKILLRRIGCENGQGFALSRPMEEEEFLNKISEDNGLAKLPSSNAPGLDAVRYA